MNMQKILLMVKELHSRGFEKLRIVPCVSPSGASWRCLFIYSKEGENEGLPATSWLHQNYPSLQDSEISESISGLTTNFLRDHPRFMMNCLGANSEYVRWFNHMLSNLEPEELPYAFADYFSPTNFWKTNMDKEIVVLPDEVQYVRHYY